MKQSRPHLPSGYECVWLAEIDSTNLEAARLANAGRQSPLWIWAQRQNAGRGRLGRSWVSEDGNLYATLLLPQDNRVKSPELSFVAALAMHATATACVGAATRSLLKLKWPNDLMLNDEKCAGVLIEQAGPECVAIGCGLNLGHVPRDGLRRPATRLALHGSTATPMEAFEQLAVSLDYWIEIWRGEGFGPVRAAWLERAYGIGAEISASMGTETVQGRFRGLEESGALLIQLADGQTKRILAADIELAT